jgi:hypothetical protein
LGRLLNITAVGFFGAHIYLSIDRIEYGLLRYGVEFEKLEEFLDKRGYKVNADETT